MTTINNGPIGVLSPLDLPAIDLANFVGYNVWTAWLLAFAFLLLRRPNRWAISPRPAEPARTVAQR